MSEDNPKKNLSITDKPLQIEHAELDWTDPANPRSIKFNDIYYSTSGARAESTHVFLNGTELTGRWQSHKTDSPTYSIAEIGFGSGLNFLNTWQLWQQSIQKPSRLHYIAFEKYPLQKADLKRLLGNWPSLSPQVAELLRHYPEHSQVCHRLLIAPDVTLDLYFGDALLRLQTINKTICSGLDSWFLDGFSPSLNPDLWQDALIKEIARLSLPGATVATYSAAGFIRRQLSDAGFLVERKPGYGKKRHMTTAVFPGPSQEQTYLTYKKEPWYRLPQVPHMPRTATVIGAGLAGCSTAYALAQRGIEVTVVDSANYPASNASGINQLALRPRLFKTASALAEFYLQSFLFAASQFSLLSSKTSRDKFWNPCGVIQLSTALNKQNKLSSATVESLYGSEIVRLLEKAQASEIAGTLITEDGLHFQLGGWVDSPSLCKHYLDSTRIRFVKDCRIGSIEKSNRANGQWEAHPTNLNISALQSDIIVLANSYSARRFPIVKSLPLQTVRGQASYTDSTEESMKLRTVLCGQRSLFPAVDSKQTISASYRQEIDLARNKDDDQENLDALASDFPQFSTLKASSSGIGIRCNTPDFKPVIGMAPNFEKMVEEYADLKRDAGKVFSNPGHYHNGLYLNLAHGSNGLATAPLAGEILASMICGEVSPLSTEALSNLSATRFLIRDLKKQRS
mgnify:CR=1 FL=1